MNSVPKVSPQSLAQIMAETNHLLAQARQELSNSCSKLGDVKKLNSALDSFRKP